MAKDKPQVFEANEKLKPLQVLAGEWETEAVNSLDTTKTVIGTVTFEFLQEGAFLIERSDTKPPFPASVAVIGFNETTGNFTQHYFDSRGVARVYEMSMLDNTWRLWRQAPGFSQRFMGTFSEDGNTITCHWEKAVDGLNYEHDFDLAYRRKK